MAKKNFATAVNTEKQEIGVNSGAVYDSIERGKDNFNSQPVASAEEQAQRKAEGRTQGRRGCKATRITMAITPDNHDYVAVMSRVTGQTYTQFINLCIEEHRKAHPDPYDQAKEIMEAVKPEKET